MTECAINERSVVRPWFAAHEDWTTIIITTCTTDLLSCFIDLYILQRTNKIHVLNFYCLPSQTISCTRGRAIRLRLVYYKDNNTLYLANWKSVNSDGLSELRISVKGTRLSRERLDDFLSICTKRNVPTHIISPSQVTPSYSYSYSWLMAAAGAQTHNLTKKTRMT